MFNKTLTAPAQTGTQCMRPDWYATMNLFAPNDSPWLNQETRGWSRCVDGNGILQRGSFLHGLYKGVCSDNGLVALRRLNAATLHGAGTMQASWTAMKQIGA